MRNFNERQRTAERIVSNDQNGRYGYTSGVRRLARQEWKNNPQTRKTFDNNQKYYRRYIRNEIEALGVPQTRNNGQRRKTRKNRYTEL